MKKRTLARLGATLLAALLLFCLPGCQSKRPARYFSYLDAPAQVTLTGKMGGTPFAATLYSEGRAGEAGQRMPDLCLTFTSPASLAGMSVRYRAEGEEWSLSLDALAGETDASGLGAIAATLCCEQPIQATRREPGTVVLTLLDGTVLTLDEATGKPLGATYARDGRVIEVTVVGWE